MDPERNVALAVAFLGKPNGAGERPITLTGCLYAIFMAGYKK